MYREYPLGVGFIGTVLKEHGYEVAIFDQNAEGLDDDDGAGEGIPFGNDILHEDL